MSIPEPKVEIFFDLTDSTVLDFFKLDDSTEGRLNNTQYKLGGALFYDITDRVRNLSVSRGRPDNFSSFPAGQLNIEFNNHDRAFDPLFQQSPFFGNIVPRREIRVSSAGQRVFSGYVDDWQLNYLPNGDSIANAIAYDGFYLLANRRLDEQTPPQETTGERINRILDALDWDTDLRDIDTGTQQVGAYLIEDESQALPYLQDVALVEPGAVYVDKLGQVKFTDRLVAPTSENLTIFCCQEFIPFDDIQVDYGSEQLYNEIEISRFEGGTAIASDIASQEIYGVRAFNQPDLLAATDDQVVELAVEYASRFSEPKYRFQGLSVSLHKLNPTDQQEVLGLELGSVVKIQFMPNGIPPRIDRYVEIISINHIVSVTTHFVEFGFRALDYTPIVLDDEVFGRLDSGTLSW